jgi:hypothetical protein
VHARARGDFADLVGPLSLGLIFGRDELRFFSDGGLSRLGLVLGALQVDESEWDLLPIAAFSTLYSRTKWNSPSFMYSFTFAANAERARKKTRYRAQPILL